MSAAEGVLWCGEERPYALQVRGGSLDTVKGVKCGCLVTNVETAYWKIIRSVWTESTELKNRGKFL